MYPVSRKDITAAGRRPAAVPSSVETGWMSSVETGQMSAVETGQMSAAETGQMSAVPESSGLPSACGAYEEAPAGV